jgi:hypothetical protein
MNLTSKSGYDTEHPGGRQEREGTAAEDEPAGDLGGAHIV